MTRYPIERIGIACPTCGSRKNHVIDTRINTTHNVARRRRICENAHRFSTVETVIAEGYRLNDPYRPHWQRSERPEDI